MAPDDIQTEREWMSAFRLAIRAAAKAGKYLSHLGDGNCGHLIEAFKDELRAEGLYTDPEPFRGYRKGAIPRSLRTQVFERDGYRCVQCQSYKSLAADHVIPESKGGPTTFENLQTLCQSCNSRKGNR